MQHVLMMPAFEATNKRLAGDLVAEKRMPVLQGIRELPVAWDVD